MSISDEEEEEEQKTHQTVITPKGELQQLMQRNNMQDALEDFEKYESGRKRHFRRCAN